MVQTGYLSVGLTNALLREGSLSSMALGTGLTHMRQYDFTRIGYFYNGLAAYVSGLERLLTIIHIYDYRLNNDGTFPDNIYIRKHSHNLPSLLSSASTIRMVGKYNPDDSFLTTDPLDDTIVQILSGFGQQGRYYNLDYLTGKIQNGDEPLARWDKDVCQEITSRHYHENPRKTEIMNELAGIMSQYSAVLHTREDGSDIMTTREFYEHGARVETKQRYGVFYLYKLSGFPVRMLNELEWRGNYYPYLHEFFPLFWGLDRKKILRKKIWDPVRL